MYLRLSSAPLLFILLYLVTSATLNADQQLDCIGKVLKTAPDDLTVKELKILCPGAVESDAGAVETRIETEKENIHDPFTILAHRSNYLLLGAYNKNGYQRQASDEAMDSQSAFKNAESQFQLSLKVPLGINVLNRNIDIYGGYTVRSFWQVYDDQESSPFRETNHEPEIWFQGYPDWEIATFKNSVIQFGINHQSNGRSEPLSRSWNRIFANFVFQKDNLAIGLKPWYRISESDDDNPDITDFMGHFQLSAAYKWKDHEFTFMSRNNIESNFEKGAIEFGWSFPLGKWHYLKGFVQYFHGYGESLIDYDEKVNRLGVGILLTDYL